MLNLPSITLPDYYTFLLKINIMGTVKAFYNHAAYISGEPSFNALVKLSFRDIDQKGRVDIILRSLGWHHFRNRMANVFIYYYSTGSYQTPSKTDFSQELVAFENKIADYEVEGHSRGFMLAFYLKLANLYLEQNNQFQSSDRLTISSELIHLLHHSSAKTVKSDWLLLILAHFDYFLGRDRLVDCLSKRESYQLIYSALKEKDKEVMVKNFLAYGFSINESEIFTSKII